MPNFSVTTVSVGGQRRNKIVTVADDARFKIVLQRAHKLGLEFGFGRLTVNSTVIPPRMLAAMLDGKVKRDGMVLFEARRRPKSLGASEAELVDLDSIM